MLAFRMIRLHVFSCYPVYRRGLSEGLGRCSAIEVTGISARPYELLARSSTIEKACSLLRRDFDVLLTDFSSPVEHELALISACSQADKKVVIVGNPWQSEKYRESHATGSSVCISKSLSLNEIAAVIEAVFNEKPVPAALRSNTEDFADSSAERSGNNQVFADLKPVEMRIMGAISRGSTNREIARGIGVSERTVRRHLTSIYRKTGVRNRTEAIAKYFKARKT